MTEERDQGPHYIPELDPERSKFDFSSIKDYYYFYSAYLVSTGVASAVLFSNGERILALATIGLGIGMIVFALWFSERSNRVVTNETDIADEREQSSHYIPELDPHNSRHKKGFGEPLFWLSMVGSGAAFVAAFVVWQFDQISATKLLVAMGAILFSPLILIACDGLYAGNA